MGAIRKQEKAVYDELAAVREAELREKQAKEEGIRQGEEQGKVQIAKKLLGKGMPLDEVATITGCSIEQLEMLVNK